MLNFLVFNPYSHSSLHQWSYLPQSGTKISEQHIKILGRISSNDVRCIHLPSLKIYHICREYQPYLSIPCRNSRNRSIIVASTFIQSSQPLSLPKTWRNRNLLLSRTSIFDRVETIISISFIKLETDEHYETGSFFFAIIIFNGIVYSLMLLNYIKVPEMYFSESQPFKKIEAKMGILEVFLNCATWKVWHDRNHPDENGYWGFLNFFFSHLCPNGWR